jgi:DNA-binding CsgD family transcriptional regulator
MTRLKARELDVVRMVAAGCTNREAAAALGLKETSIKNYLTQIFRTLGLSNRLRLVLWAIDNGVGVKPNETGPVDGPSATQLADDSGNRGLAGDSGVCGVPVDTIT